jgi:5-methylcytosine-specific restriction protein A
VQTKKVDGNVNRAEVRSMRITGKWLNKKYSLSALDARYRKNGVWYHPLKDFPAVLFDGGGYIIFSSQSEYLGAAFVKHGPDPNHIHVAGGISKVHGYKVLEPAPCEFEDL